MNIQELREQFPQYNDVSDFDLLMGVHRKFYPETHIKEFLANVDDAQIITSKRSGSKLADYYVEQVSKPMTGEAPGDTAKRLGGTSFGPISEGGRLGTAARGALQGLTYSLGDEIVAGGASALSGNPYDFELAKERERLDMGREKFPVAAYAPEVAGAVASSVGVGNAVGLPLGGTAAQRAASGVALGGAEGAASGFGAGEGVEDRAANALKFGALGATIGGAMPFATSGVGKAYDAMIGGPVSSMRSAPSEVRASRAFELALRRAGYSADDVDAMIRQAASEGQPEYMLADALGNPGQRMLAGVARAPGDARKAITDALMQRQAGQGERITSFLTDALDAPETALKYGTKLKDARGAAADVAYGAARGNAAPVDLTDTISIIDDAMGVDPILGETAFTQTEIGKRLAGIRGQLGTGTSQVIDFDRVLNVKQDLGRQIERMRNSGMSVPPQIAKVYGALDAALEASSDMYRSANDEFRAASKVIDAVDTGAASASPRMRASDVIDEFGNLKPAEASAYKVGRADTEIARVESAAEGVNKARRFTSGKSATEIPAMASDPELWKRRIGRENTMFETGNAALGGSRTADNLADIEDMQRFDVGPIVNLLKGNVTTAASQLGPAILNAMQGRNTATRARIAEMLMSKDIRAALAAAQNADKAAGPRRAVLDALARSLPTLAN